MSYHKTILLVQDNKIIISLSQENNSEIRKITMWLLSASIAKDISYLSIKR